MPTINFIDKVTVATATWLNEVDALVFDIFEGAATKSDARTKLGVQTADSRLTEIVNLSPVGDQLIYFNASNVVSLSPLSVFARTLLDDVDAATMRSTLGLVIGVNVQAWNTNLDNLEVFNGFLVQTIIATAGQTSFTLSNSYNPGIHTLMAFVNGFKQRLTADYLETSPTVVTFNVGLQLNDEVEFVILKKVPIGGTIDAANVSNGGNLNVIATGSTTARTLANRWGNEVNVKDYGAVGDGATDDTVALQAFLNLGRPGYMPIGQYRVTGELVWKNGSKLRGEGWWGGFAGTPDATKDSIIFYDGAGGTNSVVCRIASEAVGVDNDANSATRDMRGVGLSDIVVDANNKAEFGVYMVRASMAMGYFERIAIRRAKKHGLWATNLFLANMRQIIARDCEENGFTIGLNTFSWVKSNIDESVFENLYARANGTAKVFNDSVGPVLDRGVGIAVRPHRGNVFTGCLSELNDGPGWYIEPQQGPNKWIGGWIETNGQTAQSEARAARIWGIWFQGGADASSLNNEFDSVFINSNQYIRLAGTEPSSTRFEGAVKFKNIRIGAGVDASWDNYLLEDCSNEIFNNLPATKPQNMKRMGRGYIPSVLIKAAVLDFPNTAAQTSSDLTVTVTGASVSDSVVVRVPNAAVLANSNYTGWVSAANTVTVRFNNYSAGALDPTSQTFKVLVIRDTGLDITE